MVVNINECHSLSVKNWYYSITDGMSSKTIVLKDMIDINLHYEKVNI